MTINKKDAIIIDLDGTLSNCDHRLHFVRDKRKNWPEFFRQLINDPVNEWCKEIIQKFENNHNIILVSGRPDDYEDLTRQWLANNNIHYDALFMRKSKDYRKDDIVKTEIYNNFIAANYNIKFCIDDRKQIVAAWRKLGLVCLACAEGDF